jgi:hypothetical protein
MKGTYDLKDKCSLKIVEAEGNFRNWWFGRDLLISASYRA